MKTTKLHLQRSLLSAALMAAFAAPGAYAATITVDPTAADNDGIVADTKCSLREAVLSVNTGVNTGDCVADITEAYGTNDTISLLAGTYTLTLAGLDETADTTTTPGTPTAVNVPDASVGDLDLLKSVKIVGAGAATTKIQWDPAAASSTEADRIFHVYTTDAATTNIDVVVQGVTLASGKTFEENLGAGPASGSGPEPTTYFLRRAGGALAVGPAANVALVDPNITGQENSEGRGGSKRPTDPDEGGATYTLRLTDVVVENNNAQGDGGGIYTAAAMTATNVIVRNNKASTNGGGVYNEGNTSVVNSTISGNIAEGGGGFFGTGSNTVNFTGATLSANRAVGGGAISGRAAVTINLVNSTLSGNVGKDVGAGFYTNGSANLNFVTIAHNLAGADSPTAGSGINLFPAGGGGGGGGAANSVTLKNTLIADNKKGFVVDVADPTTDPLSDSFVFPDDAAFTALPSANCGVTGGGLPVTSLGSNLSSDASCDTWLTLANDLKSVNPLIGVLADNGGPTLTHKLLAGSPALGKGTAVAGITVDQRGITRDATPDIGAYEEPTPIVPPPATGGGGGGGGGGCTLANGNAPVDPTLPALAALGLIGLGVRRLRRS